MPPGGAYPYLVSRNARDFTLEATLGGRLYEDWGEGQGVVWATVVGLEEGRLLELAGSMGIEGARAVHGIVHIELVASRGSKTTLSLSHHIMGEVTVDDQQDYENGWQDLLNRLRRYVESAEQRGLHR